MQCASCGTQNQPRAVFCEQCGTQLPRACAKCGAAVSAEAKFCQTCGTSLADQPTAQVSAAIDAADRHPSPITPSSAPTADAERRQLTVMFCDLVGSTALSQQLDPEELRDLMQAYQRACGEVIARYEGHVAQYLGMGLWFTSVGRRPVRMIQCVR